MSRSCLICRFPVHETVFCEHDIPVVRCLRCHHVFSLFDRPRHYDGYFGDESLEAIDPSYWDAAHRRMYEVFGRRFLKNRTGRLLDVGCGLGFFVREVLRYPGWQACGVETSAPAVAYARERLGLGRRVIRGNVEGLPLAEDSIDVATLWDVLEHLPEPDPVLRKLRQLIQPGGGLFLHTPNVAFQLPKARLKRLLFGLRPGIHYLEARDHLHLYSMDTVRRLLRRNGFERIRFLHLPPIQAVSGRSGAIGRLLKNALWLGVVALWNLSGETVNLDNLFVWAQ